MTLAEATPIVDGLDWRTVTPGTVARVAKRFAWTPDGAPACYPVIVVTGCEPGPTATLVAGVHGDEYEGPAAVAQLVASLDTSKLRGSFTAIKLVGDCFEGLILVIAHFEPPRG